MVKLKTARFQTPWKLRLLLGWTLNGDKKIAADFFPYLVDGADAADTKNYRPGARRPPKK